MMAFVGREDLPGMDHPAYGPEPEPLDEWRFRPTVAEFCALLEDFEKDPDGLENYIERLMEKRSWNVGEFRGEITNLGGGEMLLRVFWK